MFNVGDKVLCINDDFSNILEELLRESKGLKLNFPVKDKEYTVREIFDNDGLVYSILLEEIYNPSFQIPVLNIRRELSFVSWRFVKQAEIQQLEEENEDELVLIKDDRFKKAANTGRSFSSLV